MRLPVFRQLMPSTLVFLCLLTSSAFAQEGELSAEEAAYLEELQAIVDSLNPQTGDITIGGDLVTLSVPKEFYFLDEDDAETVLVDMWGNPPGQEVLGMLFPAGLTPLDHDAWAVTIAYSDDGHVSDDDAADIDYDELLEEMQYEARAANPDRIDEGYEPIEIVGWAEPPHYEASSRKLYWAKEIQFGDMDETTLNYEIRALGRTGVLSMTFIAPTSQLDAINESREAVLAMAEFNSGRRYEDFDSSIDEVAAYGVGALVAGKVAAKTGSLAAAALLLKKVGVFILIGLGALARKMKGMFGSNELTPPK
ncbi:MAG: DUF2167 domain-containing protein [Proteobacteria bacterium]|nr:DUF2167 domain-containing protein [Pseudomonadota bacterium]